jgi:hypothetical protein
LSGSGGVKRATADCMVRTVCLGWLRLVELGCGDDMEAGLASARPAEARGQHALHVMDDLAVSTVADHSIVRLIDSCTSQSVGRATCSRWHLCRSLELSEASPGRQSQQCLRPCGP